jgi:hypothetical protein
MINLLYQTWLENNRPISNSVVPHKRKQSTIGYQNVKHNYLENMFGVADIEYKQCKISDINDNEIYYYHIQPEWIDLAFYYENVFYNIDKDMLELIKNKPNVRILIWFPSEGFSLKMDRFIGDIIWSLGDMGIAFNKVFFVYGDLNITQNWERYKNNTRRWDVDINFYPFNIFEHNYRHECNVRYFSDHPKKKVSIEDELVDIDNLDLDKIRSKRYLCKNANPREHRILIVSELFRKGLDKHGIISFLNRYFDPNNFSFVDRYTDEEVQIKSQHAEHWSKNQTPIILDHDKNTIEEGMNQRILKREHFADTYFSFVTETVFDDAPAPLFITEKIYQPMMNYHPFIVTAGPGCLQYLRDQGYETFPEMFNESYDKMSSLKQRYAHIMSEVERLCAMDINQLNSIYKKIVPKLKHNREHFLKKDTRQNFMDLLKWLK